MNRIYPLPTKESYNASPALLSDNWHLNHMYDPQSTSPGSIMPSYKWLVRNELDKSQPTAKMKAMVSLGVPYTDEDIANAQASMLEQGTQIEKNLYTDPDFAKAYEYYDNALQIHEKELVQKIQSAAQNVSILGAENNNDKIIIRIEVSTTTFDCHVGVAQTFSDTFFGIKTYLSKLSLVEQREISMRI